MSTFQVGLSWPEWISDPSNKRLFETNQAEALKKFKHDEEEYIHELILQERIQQERQQKLQEQLRQLVEQEDSTVASPGIGSVGGAAGGAASGGGGFAFNTGIGNFAIGTFLNSSFVPVDALVDEGFERFTVS